MAISSELAAQVAQALDELGACAATQPWPFATFLRDRTSSDWVAYIDAQLSADERALLTADTFVAITQLARARRQQQQAIEAELQTATGRPWSSLRYFSTEEHADDVSVAMTHAAALPEPGTSGLMLQVLGDARAACEQALVAGAVPYGINLADDHHGTCWRIAHAQQLDAAGHYAARRAPAVPEAPRAPFVPTIPSDGKPMY